MPEKWAGGAARTWRGQWRVCTQENSSYLYAPCCHGESIFRMSSLGEKGEEKREEERERKRERRKEEGHPLGVAGDGERFPFPLLARTMPTFLMYPVFPPLSHPSSSQRTKRWYEERILCNDGSFDHEQGSSRELLLLFFYYSWNTRIVKMEIRIDKCKFDVANFLLSIHFSLEK